MASAFQKLDNLLAWVCRILIGGIFIYAGMLKALDPSQFLTDVENYRLFPHFFSVVIALYLPWIEILCGLSLWIFRWDRGALLILWILMLGFTGALASAWARGLNITCGCFGKSDHPVSYTMLLLRDFAIMMFLGVVSYHQFLKDRKN